MNLSSTIKSIQDIMRKDDGVDGDAQRIGQLTWMLFLKVFDQQEEEKEDKAKIGGPPYTSPLPEEYRWRNWAAYKNGKSEAIPKDVANAIVTFVNNELFPQLKSLDVTDDPMAKVICQVFKDLNNSMKSGLLMLDVIKKLNEAIDFHDFKTRQNLGDIYEQILNDLRSAGNAGEFYTPRAITRFMVNRSSPQLSRREKVMDPACGTGGFLTATIDHLRNQLTDHSSDEDQKAIEESIIGVEKKQLPHLLCATNLLLHGIDVPSQADRYNTLEQAWESWDENDQVECVITNPPFGGFEGEDVGGDYPEEFRTRETADMFLTLIVSKLLKDGGRGAIVLPDGALFGEGVKSKIKKLLLDECNLHTIIRLPNGAFAPYTNIKSNLLFFTKGRPTETIWFYEHPYPEGQKSYSKSKPIQDKEFDAEKDWWGKEENDFAERQENERAWKIDFETRKQNAEAQAKPHWDEAEKINSRASELENQARNLRDSLKGLKGPEERKSAEDRITELRAQADDLRRQARDAKAAGDRLFWPIYNLDIKNPNTPEEESHDPDVLLEKYKKLLADIEETQELLKSELGAALAHHFESEAV